MHFLPCLTMTIRMIWQKKQEAAVFLLDLHLLGVGPLIRWKWKPSTLHIWPPYVEGNIKDSTVLMGKNLSIFVINPGWDYPCIERNLIAFCPNNDFRRRTFSPYSYDFWVDPPQRNNTMHRLFSRQYIIDEHLHFDTVFFSQKHLQSHGNEMYPK